LTDGDQPAVPNVKDYKIIRDCVGLGNVFDHLFIAEAEREVVGTQKRPEGRAFAEGQSGFAKGEVNITAPATEAAKQWDGWGSALKPSCEFFTLARKPLSEKTIAQNVLKWGTGGINIDGCRVEFDENEPDKRIGTDTLAGGSKKSMYGDFSNVKEKEIKMYKQGRFPANLIHDGSDEAAIGMGDKARYFYCAKASKSERNEGLEGFKEKESKTMNERSPDTSGGSHNTTGQKPALQQNHHPTVKPIALMRYLCRLITPRGGVILDPYMGSGSTGIAAKKEGFHFIGIELDEEYFEIAKARIGV